MVLELTAVFSDRDTRCAADVIEMIEAERASLIRPGDPQNPLFDEFPAASFEWKGQKA